MTGIGGNYSFQYNYDLEMLAVPSSITSIGSNALQDCRSLRSLTVPSGITNFTNVCQGCYSLKTAVTPASNIGTNAFNGCSQLEDITFSNTSTTTIGNNAFSGCTYLTSIIIPQSVTSIGSGAYASGFAVTSIHVKPTSPPTLSSTTAFSDIPSDVPIYVPSGSLATYQAADNWSTFSSRMIGE